MKFVSYACLVAISLVILFTILGFYRSVVLSEASDIALDPVNMIPGTLFGFALAMNIANWICIQKRFIWCSRVLFTIQSCGIAFFGGVVLSSSQITISHSNLLIGLGVSLITGFLAFFLSAFFFERRH